MALSGAQSEASGADGPGSSGGLRRYRGILKQIERRIRAMFPDINRVNRAMFRLRDLSEDLRILSLNAELAAGRAGNRGAAVRALTQYTRGLVGRLIEINDNAAGLQVLYAASTAALRTLHHVRQLEDATTHVDHVDPSPGSLKALQTLQVTRTWLLREVAGHVTGISAGISRLATMVRVVDDVVSQAASIATNIATEAVAAGSHEAEFRAVAETMTRYVEELRLMNDQAARGLRGANQECESLRDTTATLTRQTVGAMVRLETGGTVHS
jgi:hypothetical protein